MIRNLQDLCVKWHEQRFPNAEASLVLLKTCEEMGEVASAFLALEGGNSATGKGEIGEEIADVFIALMAFTGRWFPEVIIHQEILKKMRILMDSESDHPAALKE